MDDMKSGQLLSNKSHYRFLDGLRGLAVLFVLFSHASGYGIAIIPGLNAGGAGKTGVWLFFVLSAFLLTGRLDSMATKGQLNLHSLAGYFIRRVMRIYPVFVLALVPWVAQGTLDGQAIFDNVFLVEGIYWVIPVEFKFYFLIPLIVITFHLVFKENLALFATSLVCVGIAINLFNPPSLALNNSISLWPYILVFILGSVGALAVARGVTFRWMKGYTPYLFFLFPIITIPSVTSFVVGEYVKFNAFHSFSWLFGLIWIIALASCFNNRPLKFILSLNPLCFTGKISFSLYLFHGWVLSWVLKAEGTPNFVKAAAFMLISFVLSTVTYYLIEVPGIKAGRYISARIMTRRAGDREQGPTNV